MQVYVLKLFCHEMSMAWSPSYSHWSDFKFKSVFIIELSICIYKEEQPAIE